MIVFAFPTHGTPELSNPSDRLDCPAVSPIAGSLHMPNQLLVIDGDDHGLRECHDGRRLGETSVARAEQRQEEERGGRGVHGVADASGAVAG